MRAWQARHRRVGASGSAVVVARLPARAIRRIGQLPVPAPLGPPFYYGPPASSPIMSQSTGPQPGITPQSTPYTPSGAPPEYETPKPPCVPLGGDDVMVAGEVTITATENGGNAQIVFNFSGSFCPRMLFLADGTGVAFVTGLTIGAKSLHLGGNVPASLFSSADNACCPVFNMACVCGPGIPLTLKLRSAANGTVRATMFGQYCEACPPPQYGEPVVR